MFLGLVFYLSMEFLSSLYMIYPRVSKSFKFYLYLSNNKLR